MFQSPVNIVQALTLLKRFISIRALVAVFCLSLLLSPGSPKILQLLDGKLFKTASKLTTIPSKKHDIAIVGLSEAQANQLSYAPETASEIISWLKKQNLTRSHVSLIVDSLAKAQPNDFAKDNEKALDNKRWLASRVLDNSLHIGLIYSGQAQAEAAIDKNIADEKILDLSGKLTNDTKSQAKLVHRFYRLLGLYPEDISLANSDKVLPFFLAGSNENHARKIVWQKDETSHHALELSIFKHTNKIDDLNWSPFEISYTRKEKTEAIETNRNGQIWPLFSSTLSTELPSTIYEFDQVKRKTLENKVIIVGRSGASAVLDTAGAFASIDNRAYISQPLWSFWLQKLLLALSIIYLILVLPLLSINGGLIVSGFFILTLTIFQLGWQIINWQMLPLGLITQTILIGHGAMIFWLKNNDAMLELQTELHEAKLLLAHSLFKQNDMEASQSALARCATDLDVLELLYKIALEHERKRQYQQAIKSYDEILSRKRSYLDVKERRAELSQMQETGAPVSSDFSATHTAVIPGKNVENPILGRYEIQKEIGRGAMGVVYLGIDPQISREVAIKTLNYAQFDEDQIDELKSRFFLEAEAAGRLSHPNIVTVYDVGEEPDLAFIAMDYVEGKALNAYVKKQSLLDPARVYEIIADVAEALDYAHQNKIVHRDIKPGNIIYNQETELVTVTDFGIARVADNSRTKTGEVLGSPFYMSPEQLKGGKLSGQTDLYSLGVTMFQLLCGELPFEGDNLANLTYEILNKKHKNIRDINPDLPTSATRIINKALQKDPAKRFDGAKEMAEHILKSLDRDFA